MVYMAQSVSLAVLENLVHMSRDFPTGYVAVAAVIPKAVDVVAESELRAERHLQGWSSQALGDYWLESGLSPVLRVSSAVVPAEFNYLLNPLHPEFAEIQVEAPVIFVFDERLFG